MTRTVDHAPDAQPPAEQPDWENLFPADPELMVSPEGDRKGLAELKKRARDRIERLSQS